MSNLKTVKIMEKNLFIGCRFSDFLQAYCGTVSVDEQFETARDSFFKPGTNENITGSELLRSYKEWVEIRFEIYDYNGDGTVHDELLLSIVFANGENLEFTCDCVDVKQFINDLSTITLK